MNIHRINNRNIHSKYIYQIMMRLDLEIYLIFLILYSNISKRAKYIAKYTESYSSIHHTIIH